MHGSAAPAGRASGIGCCTSASSRNARTARRHPTPTPSSPATSSVMTRPTRGGPPPPPPPPRTARIRRTFGPWPRRSEPSSSASPDSPGAWTNYPVTSTTTVSHARQRPSLRKELADHVLQPARVGVVAEQHDLPLPDPEHLDRRRHERPSRRGQGSLRPHLHDHYLRVLSLVELRHLEVVQPQRRRHDMTGVLADRLPPLQAHARARRPRERTPDHPIRGEQLGE